MMLTVQVLRTATADARSNRASFLLQLSFMLANDVTWVIFWSLLFHRIGSAAHWTLNDVLLMLSFLTVTAGVALGVFGNCRHVGRLIADGALDEVLTLPVHPLPHLLARRVEPANVGDLVFGSLLFAVAGHPTPERVGLFLLAVAAGSSVLIGFLVALGSLTFFTGGRGEQADLGLNAIVLLANYPLDFFGGPTKLLMFTLVPAAFITGVPVNLFRHFSATSALWLAVAAVVALVTAVAIFTCGLRRYSSGSVWRR